MSTPGSWAIFRRRWSVATFFGVLFPLFFAVPLLAAGTIFFGGEVEYATDGIVTEAIVEETWEEERTDSEGDDYSVYWVAYHFEPADNLEIAGQDSIGDRRSWSGVQSGDSIEIEYLAAQPGNNRLSGGSTTNMVLAIVVLVLGMIPAAIAAVFFLRHFRSSVKIARLYVHGTRGSAEVIGLEKSNFTVNKKRYVRVLYQYRGAQGEPRTGRSVPMSPDSLRVRPGDSIPVLYDQADPETSFAEI